MLADDDVPARPLVLELFIYCDHVLNLGTHHLVEIVQCVCLVTN